MTSTEISNNTVLTMSLIGERKDVSENLGSVIHFPDMEPVTTGDTAINGLPVSHYPFTGTDREIIRGILRHVIAVLAGTRCQDNPEAYNTLVKQLHDEYLPR